MIAITHFRDESADFAERARPALAALAARPGYLRGTVARATDDPHAWLLLTEWQDVGSYRRALGDFQFKVHGTPLFATALDLPAGFEELLEIRPDGELMIGESDRES